LSSNNQRPFRIAEICYRPWDEFPWYVVRTGGIAEQGGLRFGVEGIGFITLEDACNYVTAATKRDLPVIEDIINEKNKWKDVE
jgi:hypothetical protein